MKNLFKKKSKQYSNISEPVSDLDPQRIASLKSRNYSDLDPEVIRKIKLQHLNHHQSESISTTLSQTGGVVTAVSRTNSSTTHATMPSTDQTEHSSGSQNSGSAQNHSVSNAVVASGNTFPAPPGSPSKSKRKLFLLKKKQATNASNKSPSTSAVSNHKDNVPVSQKKSFKDMPSRLKSTDTTDSSATTEKMVLTTSTHKTSSVPVTPDTLESQNNIHHPMNVSNDYLHQYDDEMDAGTDAPTEFFQPSYLFKDAIDQSYDEIIPDEFSGQKAEIQQNDPETTSLDHNGKARNNGPTTSTQLSANNEQLDTPPPPPTKRLNGFRKRSPTPPPTKQKHSSHTMKESTKRRQNHEKKNLIFRDIGTSSTCSELDKTFDPEIVSVSSDITSPTFQPLDTSTGIGSSLHGNKNTSPSTSWREKIQLSLTKSCANNEDIKMGTRRNSFWDTFVDGLCSSKPVSTVNDSSDHGDEVYEEL